LFQFVNVRELGTIDLLAKHTPHDVVNWVKADFQRFCGLAILFELTRYQYAFTVANRKIRLLHFTR